MKSLFGVGLAVIALMPAFLILCLSIYKIYNDIKKKRFEKKGNIVLTRQRIGEIVKHKDPSELVKIFKSAICDHSEVGDLKYYTKFPFGLKIVTPHDNHRKAFIANEIGNMLTKTVILNGDMNHCKDALFCLTDCSKEQYYTQLIAWNSLSKLSPSHKSSLLEQIEKDYLKIRISDNFMAGIGIVKFIFNLKGQDNLDNALINRVNDIISYFLENGAPPLLALFVFKLIKDHHFTKSQKKDLLKRLPDDPKLKNFINHTESLLTGFTKTELSEGLRNLGFQPRPYSHRTTEGEIIRFLIKDFLEEIYVPSSYLLHSFDSFGLRQYLMDYLWISKNDFK
jgi:hypothetical protein